MTIALALLAGAFIGSVLGFIGAGGAMLSVPILIYIFHFTPIHASTAALLVVFLAAISGVIPKIRSKNVRIREALTISSLGLTTNVLGSIYSKHLSPRTIMTGFALVLILAGVSMLRKPLKDQSEKRMPLPVLILLSLIIGAFTGIFGIGGGFLAVPILVLFYHTPQSKAAGTSLLIISVNSTIAFLGHQSQWRGIQWHIPFLMASTAILVAWFASKYSTKLPAAKLRIAFACLLFAVSLFTLTKNWYFYKN